MQLDASLTLRDEGLSAYHQRHVTRGALGTFLRAVEDGRVPTGSVLIVEGLDRLSRAEPIQAQAQLAQIVNAGITVVTASDGREYNREKLRQQPMDLVYSLLVMIRAHEESDTKSKRVKAAIRRQCQAWIAGTHRKPIRVGRDPQWVREVDGRFELIPERAEAMRLAVSMYLDGHGAHSVVRHLTSRGLVISDKCKTNSSHLYKIFVNRCLVGEKTVEIDGEEFRLEGYYPPVLKGPEFDKLRAIGDLRMRQKGKGEIPGIITGIGICVCGYCGKPMTAQNLNKHSKITGRRLNGFRRIMCNSFRNPSTDCPMPGSVSARPIERAITHYCADQMNLTSLIEGDSGATAITAQLVRARQRAGEADAKVKRLTDMLLADSGEAPSAVLKRIREFEEEANAERAEVEALERQLASASRLPPGAAQAWADLVKGIEELDYDTRMKGRRLVSETFSRIVVYTRGFTPRDDDRSIGLLLVAKRGTTRMLNVHRKTGEWQAAEELASHDIPLPLAAE